MEEMERKCKLKVRRNDVQYLKENLFIYFGAHQSIMIFRSEWIIEKLSM